MTLVKRLLPRALKGKIRRLAGLSERRRYTSEQRALITKLRQHHPERPVIEEFVDRRYGGVQQLTVELGQFAFASDALAKLAPAEIVDIGSHRAWIVGVAAGIPVHSVDVREPQGAPAGETFHQGRGEHLPFADGSIECLTTLSSIEHFGLGSYGDQFDPDGDVKAAREIARVLRPGGHLILSTLCTGRDTSFVVFNARRVYSLADIESMHSDLENVEYRLLSRQGTWIEAEELQTGLAPYAWDMYLGVWRKPG